MAKNVGFIVRCEECQKSRLIHSKLKLKKEDTQGAQRMLKKLSYMCGASPAEYVGTGYRYEKFLAICLQYISCTLNNVTTLLVTTPLIIMLWTRVHLL